VEEGGREGVERGGREGRRAGGSVRKEGTRGVGVDREREEEREEERSRTGREKEERDGRKKGEPRLEGTVGAARGRRGSRIPLERWIAGRNDGLWAWQAKEGTGGKGRKRRREGERRGGRSWRLEEQRRSKSSLEFSERFSTALFRVLLREIERKNDDLPRIEASG